MNTLLRSFCSAFALVATLCWQAPAFADPPRPIPNGPPGHNQDRHDDRGGRNNNRPDDRDPRYNRDPRPPYHADNGHHGDPRYPRYPVYPVRPVYPVVPVYPVYPRYPAYYVYRGYPRYYYYAPYGAYVYRGYYGDPWRSDYGVVSSGRCNTGTMLGVAGAVTGAIIGNASSAPQNSGVATVFGAIAGGIIGAAVGSSIDNNDRACFGQALELAPVGHPVAWANPHSHVDWQLTPVRDVSAECREFDVRRGYYGSYGTERVTACRQGPGQWAFQS